MNRENNNISKSAENKIKCYYQNKWEKWYWELVDSRKLLKRKYDSRIHEKHHIISKFIKDDDSPQNLVILTFREHFISHLLLALGYGYAGFWYAFNQNSKKWEINSRTFERIKSLRSIGHTEETKSLIRKKRKLQIITEEHKRKISLGLLNSDRIYKPHTEESKAKMRKTRLKFLKNKSSWDHPHIQSNPEILYIWSVADKIKEMIDEGKRPIEIQKKLGICSRSSLMTIREKIKKGWNPVEDKKWINDFIKR